MPIVRGLHSFCKWLLFACNYLFFVPLCSADVASVALPSETKKTVDEFNSVDNRTTFFFDPHRFGGSAYGSVNGSGGAQHGGNANAKCCQCTGPRDKLENKEKTHQFKIEFENFLQNKIYVKNS